MSPQILELFIFASIALVIINWLISVVGTSDIDDKDSPYKSSFGARFKDVTSSGYDWTSGSKGGSKGGSKMGSQMGSKMGSKATVKIVSNSNNAGYDSSRDSSIEISKDLLNDPEDLDLIESIMEAAEKVEKFTPAGFVKNAHKAWKMIIEALQAKNSEMIGELVDSRFIDKIKDMREYYMKTDLNDHPDIKFSDVTFFGHSVLIKLMITNELNTSEEWTFIRNLNQSGPNWFLSNIERIS